jgi:hypothetical protein
MPYMEMALVDRDQLGEGALWGARLMGGQYHRERQGRCLFAVVELPSRPAGAALRAELVSRGTGGTYAH